MQRSQNHESGDWVNPGREFSLLPFWFWNDKLSYEKLLEQIEDFERHGVYGFVIHPRVGLPRDCGWMSLRLLDFIKFAVSEAAKRGMNVVLYDEGMYPSGSSSGQVVAENPEYQVRCLDHKILSEEDDPNLLPGENLITVSRLVSGERIAIFDRKLDGVIRGLHYKDESLATEDEPPAADLLNPAAMACYRRLVYERYESAVGQFFGSTVIGIFTDEPSLVGRTGEISIRPGSAESIDHVNRILGYDIRPHLSALWYASEPDAEHWRTEYKRALLRRLDETYYAPLSHWCEERGIALMGHPAEPDDYGLERYFQIPGQDLVWRHVLPGTPSALEGEASTQAKCSSSAMVHFGRRRNSNECFGAYGKSLTYEETVWLVNWCFIRGVNMLIPHAFYYSMRGPRADERPPDVGPNSSWWNHYAEFAEYCRRLSWLNTDSIDLAKVAILGRSDKLPWSAAKVCFENQIDFNYLDPVDLANRAQITANGITIAGRNYEVLIVDETCPPSEDSLNLTEILEKSRRRLFWSPSSNPSSTSAATALRDEHALAVALRRLTKPDNTIDPQVSALRVRSVAKENRTYRILFNEGEERVGFDLALPLDGAPHEILDPWTSTASRVLNGLIELAPHQLIVIRSDARSKSIV